MNKGSMEYKRIMDGLGKIPGLSLPIPGLSKSGYKPVQSESIEMPPAPAFSSLSENFAPVNETRKPLSKEDKRIFLEALKTLYAEHASTRKPLNESSDIFSEIEKILRENRGNQYLERTYESLLSAVKDFDLARGHLKMVIKNTAEYIKSM